MDFKEVLSESRKISATQTNTEQSIVVTFELDPESSASDPIFEFFGDDQDAAALEYAYSIFPLLRILPNSEGTPLPLVILSVDLEETTNYGRWKATAKYRYDLNAGQSGGPDDPEDDALDFIRINFNVGGGTTKITESLTDPTFASATNRPKLDTGRGIRVTEDTIEGTEIPSSGLQLMVTVFYFPGFAFNVETIRNVFLHLHKRVNNGTFMGFEEGEVLLLELSGGGTFGEIVPITFTFDVKENRTNDNDGEFTD